MFELFSIPVKVRFLSSKSNETRVGFALGAGALSVSFSLSFSCVRHGVACLEVGGLRRGQVDL